MLVMLPIMNDDQPDTSPPSNVNPNTNTDKVDGLKSGNNSQETATSTKAQNQTTGNLVVPTTNNSSTNFEDPNTPPQKPVKRQAKKMVWIVVFVAIVIVSFISGRYLGTRSNSEQAKEAEQHVAMHPVKELSVPPEATVISECSRFRGKQFVLPEDIPTGPVYNVYEGEVIGLEFMLGKEELDSGEDFVDLAMGGVEYDHMDVGLLSEGHAGYPEPHYHIDIYTISKSEAEKITCQ